jgi:SAM-dependent methyltransferase
MAGMLGGLLKRIIPASAYRKLVLLTRDPPVGRIDFGDLRTVRPLNDNWGFDRGLPVDRYFIDKFLETYSADIKGHVLEVGTDEYTKKFGGKDVQKNEILHVSADYERATIVADLTQADNVADNQFDCVICTQTLQFIYKVEAAITTLFRILKPGGTLLVTFPGVSQISRYDMDRWGDYWRFTSASASRLFADLGSNANVEVVAYGNVFAAIAFLHGLAVEDFTSAELDVLDPDYELLLGVRIVKTKATM